MNPDYSIEERIDKELSKKDFWLHFKGINYSANIWVNGRRIAGSDYVIGAFRRYWFNITHLVKPGLKNVLAIEVFSQNPDDLGICFVDWCPVPPDDNMGIWQPVLLCTSGPIAMRHTFVRSRLNVETLKDVANKSEIDIGVIATSSSGAQDVANRFIDANIHAILNFSPAQINVPDYCVIEHIDFTIKLDILTYKLKYEIGI